MQAQLQGFFSYPRESVTEPVKALHDRLESEVNANLGRTQPFALFMDTQDLELGEFWSNRLAREIGRSVSFCWVQTPDWFASKICQLELIAYVDHMTRMSRRLGLNFGQLRDCMIAPIRLRDVRSGVVAGMRFPIPELYSQLNLTSTTPLLSLGDPQRADVTREIGRRLTKMLDRLTAAVGSLEALARDVEEPDDWVRRWAGLLGQEVRAEANPDLVMSPTAATSAPRPYEGVQASFRLTDSDPWKRLLEWTCAEPSTPSPLRQVLSALDVSPPFASEALVTTKQKYELYGGDTRSSRLGALKSVFGKLTFERDLAAETARRILEGSAAFSSTTIVARPSQGKSIALAQIVQILSASPGHLTFWSIDGAGSFKVGDPARAARLLARTIEQAQWVPTGLTFVFDDLSTRPDGPAIAEFHQAIRDGPRFPIPVSFVFGSADPVMISDQKDTHELVLTEGDERRVYEQLADLSPPVMRKRYPTIEELIAAAPRKRQYADDIQSFIDFVLSQSHPVEAFRPSWFVGVPGETPGQERLVQIVAVCQLLDLPLPSRLAETLLGNDPKGLPRQLGSVQADWIGVALRSPHYAYSLLRSANRMDGDFIFATLLEVLERSLAFSKQAFAQWRVQEADFVRHVFQRLTKRQIFVYEGLDLRVIAERLFRRCERQLCDNLDAMDTPLELAAWAGTLSSLPNVGDLVFRLCRRAADLAATTPLGSRGTVVLLRAMRRLLNQGSRVKGLSALAKDVDGLVDLEALLRLEFQTNLVDAEHRANELLLAGARFIRKTSAPWRDRLNRIERLYAAASTLFGERDAALDAGNLLEREKIAFELGEAERATAFLAEARTSVFRFPRQQATWAPLVAERLALRRLSA